MNVHVTCPHCRGACRIPTESVTRAWSNHTRSCPTCDGRGRVDVIALAEERRALRSALQALANDAEALVCSMRNERPSDLREIDPSPTRNGDRVAVSTHRARRVLTKGA